MSTRKRYFKIVDPDKDEFGVPIGWNKIPDKLFELIPKDYISNVLAIDSSGEIGEKTVVFVDEKESEKKAGFKHSTNLPSGNIIGV